MAPSAVGYSLKIQLGLYIYLVQSNLHIQISWHRKKVKGLNESMLFRLNTCKYKLEIVTHRWIYQWLWSNEFQGSLKH